jgi:hypothetical protein
MAAAAKALAVPPTPEEVEKLALEYNKLKDELLEAILASKVAGDDLTPVKTKCIELVRKFGTAHAKKSKLLHGIKWEMMATFGSSTSPDAAAIENLRQHLLTVKKTRLLKLMFEMTPRWTLKETARVEILKPGIDDEIRALFALCEVPSDSTPKLEVREKEKQPA